MTSEGTPTLDRLEDQIAWYDKESGSNKRWYKSLQVLQIASAVAIPVLAGAEAPGVVVGILGGGIALIEGVDHLNKFHENWITYRSTAEYLKHEKFLHLASAGPYAVAENPDALLAERIEGLVSQEHAKWVSSAQERSKGGHT